MGLPRTIATVAAAALLAAAVASCGVGEGPDQEGVATLTVTRDYGGERMLEASVEDPSASETVVRLLDGEAEIETSYNGNFVDAIGGLSGGVDGGRSLDWFFYVNGYWSPVGAGEARVRPGDRIWWDFRDWTDAYRIPAVVGSYPQPFADGFDGESFPTEVVCFEASESCDEVVDRLGEEGVEAERRAPAEAGGEPTSTLRVLVGPWERVRADPAAALLERTVQSSGVFARAIRCEGSWALSVRDSTDSPVATLRDAGWIAAVRRAEDQPTWIVAGTDGAAVGAAADALDPETLAQSYALAIPEDPAREPIGLPVADPEGLDLGGSGC